VLEACCRSPVTLQRDLKRVRIVHRHDWCLRRFPFLRTQPKSTSAPTQRKITKCRDQAEGRSQTASRVWRLRQASRLRTGTLIECRTPPVMFVDGSVHRPVYIRCKFGGTFGRFAGLDPTTMPVELVWRR
jgi:hypothetical protein